MKQQIFIDDVHEYDYELIDDNIHTLLYSGGYWDSKILNSKATNITDDGNGLLIGFNKEIKTKIHIDYAQAERLFILLKLVLELAKYEIATKQLL